MIKAIFWDNDGVLVDTERLYYRATREVLLSVGVDLTQESYLELLMVQGKGAWHLAEERGVSRGRIEGLREERNHIYGGLLERETTVIEGVANALSELGGKYRMGIVTSSLRSHLDLIHRSTGLMKFFDFVIASGDYARSKPCPDPYIAAIAKSGLPASECIAVEDSERGLASAVAAGLKCLVIPNALTRGCTFAGAHRILASATEVGATLD